MATTFEPKVYARPADSVFSDTQWNTLLHIFDGFVPRLTPEEVVALKKDYASYTANPVDESLIDAYVSESAAEVPEFVEDVNTVFNNHLPPEKIKELGMVLNLLNTRPGSYVLTGYVTPLHLLPRKDVEIIIQGWSSARLETIRQLYKAFSFVCKFIYQRGSPAAHAAMGFPGFPFSDESKAEWEKTLEAADAEPMFHFEDLELIDARVKLDQNKPATELPIELTTDILILGSGSGGGVVANHLSAALPSHKIMVVERGFWYPKHKLPTAERDMLAQLYEERASIQTEDGSLGIIAGNTWGGGSTVNWSVSWQLQGSQRREWAEKYGLKFATGREFQNCLDYISNSMSVQPLQPHQHNASNKSTLNGSHLLGFKALAVPQNILGDPDKHNKICGAFCTGGCKGAGEDDKIGGGGKQGTARSFLINARDRGAKFVQGFECTKLLFDKSGAVTGAHGRWRKSDDEASGTGKKVIIRAKRVIVSAGALNTPAILLRSGLKNYYIGRNLHLHPSTIVNATWKEETKPWEGGILTSVGTEFDNIDGKGHGARAEGMLMLPGMGLLHAQWRSALEYRQHILRYRHMTGTVMVCRDRDAGRVFIDPISGKAKVDYVPSAFDRDNLAQCVVGTCQILHAAGALEIFSPVTHGPIYRKSADPVKDEEAFDDFITKVEKQGIPMVESSFGSAHQMGSCSMGTSARNSVVDDRGRVWGSKNLYIADASLFPSASGVNPMVTTMALSEWVSRAIVKDVQKEEETDGRARL